LIGVEVKAVTRYFGKVLALDRISLTLEPGLIHGVIGPEGAGKTTLMRTLLGLLDCKAGEIRYFRAAEPSVSVPLKHIRPFVAYMPEKQSLYGDLSVMEHLRFFKNLYGIPEKLFAEKTEEMLHLTRLAPFAERQARQLSGGMYKKLGLMCALLRSPQMVLLDEPTNGVDPISRREFWELLHQLRVQQNITIVMSTAYMDEAERCEKVHLLESGRVLVEGAPQELREQYEVSGFDELFIKKAQL
jgi:ABC-2 type transport system ATP-binding protein